MSDRIAIMLDGRLQQFDAPQTVYRAPANRFVAGFIGTPSMNLIDGQLASDGGRWVFSAPGVSLALDTLGPQAAAGQAALGVRPEHVTLGSGPMQGVVQIVEQTGHENIVTVRLDGDVRLTGRVPASQMWRTGETIAVGIQSAEAHVFGPGPTGPRLNRPVPATRPADAPKLVHSAP